MPLYRARGFTSAECDRIRTEWEKQQDEFFFKQLCTKVDSEGSDDLQSAPLEELCKKIEPVGSTVKGENLMEEIDKLPSPWYVQVHNAEPCQLDSLLSYDPQVSYFEITISYPHCQSFLKKTVQAQKELYSKIWHYILHAFGPDCTDRFVMDRCLHTFEFSRKGQVHMHGLLCIKHVMYFMGTLNDIVRTVLKEMPNYKKCSFFNEAYSKCNGRTYEAPAVCVRYQDEPLRIQYWIRYIYKEQKDKDLFICEN